VDEKPQFEQERIILVLFSFVLYGKRGNSCTIKMFFLRKRDLVFYLTILSTFYSLLTRSTWVLTLKVQLHVPLIIWGILLSAKIGVKSLFYYFGLYYI